MIRRALLLGSLLVFSGCAVVSTGMKSESKLGNLALGQQRTDVLKTMGKPDRTHGEQQKDGSALQIDEYKLYPSGQPFRQIAWGILTLTAGWWFEPSLEGSEYWIYYVNEKVIRWGRPQDFYRR